MSLFDRMLEELKLARLLMSPYKFTDDDENPRRRELAKRFDAIIAEAEKARALSVLSYRDVIVGGRKFRVNFDPATGKARSVDGWVNRRIGYYREIWSAKYASKPGPLARKAIEAASKIGDAPS